MPDTDLIPDIRSKRVKYRIFSKNRRQRMCSLPRSVTNQISKDQIFHFQWKKNWDLNLNFFILYIIFNFVKNCLHVCSLILFLGLGNIPEEIWSISKGCLPLPSPPPLPRPPPPPWITEVSRDRGNPPRLTSRPIPRLFQRSKEKSVTSRSYTFFKNVNDVADMTCRRFK